MFPRSPMGCDGTPGCKASQGDSFWTAPNPAFGATFTYYLAEEVQSSKDARREREKEKEKNNENVVAVDWDTVIAESREDAPAIVFTIRFGRWFDYRPGHCTCDGGLQSRRLGSAIPVGRAVGTG